MFKVKKHKFEKIKNFLKTTPRTLGRYAFLTSLMFFFFAMILGGLVFYKYIILIEWEKPEYSEKLLYFNEKKLQEVMQAWQDRQKRFEKTDSKQYINPFMID